MLIEIPLPRFSKKGKSTTLSLNSYRNLHYQVLNKSKRDYETLYKQLLKFKNLKTPIEIEYTLYFLQTSVNKRDLSNYGCMVDKIFCDALVKYGMIKDDNTKYIKKITYIFGGVGNDYASIKINKI